MLQEQEVDATIARSPYKLKVLGEEEEEEEANSTPPHLGLCLQSKYNRIR